MQAVAGFDDLERASVSTAMKAAAVYNLGVAAATAGDLALAEKSFTRALQALAASMACDRDKV